MSGDSLFLTRADGTLPPDIDRLQAMDLGQNAKVAVDRTTRALRVTVVSPPSSAALKAAFDPFSKTVASAGTPERLWAVAGVKLADQIIVTPLRANTGIVFLGTEATNDSQAIEAPFIFGAPDGKKIDAYDIFADVTVNGEGVRVTLIN